MKEKGEYKEADKLRSNFKTGGGDAVISVRSGIQLRADYMHYWRNLDSNGEVDAQVYAELDLGTEPRPGRKPSLRKRTARCAIRISILQAFVEAKKKQLTLRELQDYWGSRSMISMQTLCQQATLKNDPLINDIAALCGIHAPQVKQTLHPNPPLEVVSYGESVPTSSNSKHHRNRTDSRTEAREIEHLESQQATNPTERDALVKVRINQGQFRRDLLERWNACSVTGIQNPTLLVASHIKPWSVSTNREKLDPDNGLLLAAHLDQLFDSGLISFSNDGSIKISPEVSDSDRVLLHIDVSMSLRLPMSDSSQEYMRYHRTNIFRPS